MKLRHFFMLTLAGALIFGACGGDDDDDSGDNGAKDQATQPTGASEATKASADPTKGSDATKPAASATTEDAGSVFERLAGDGIKKTYVKPFSKTQHEGLTAADFGFVKWSDGKLVQGEAAVTKSLAAGDLKS